MNNYDLEHIVGVQADIFNGIVTIDDKDIAFAAARHVVVQNIDSNAQRFIPTGEITTLARSPSRDLIGVAEKGTGVVKLYDAKTLRCIRKLPHKSGTNIRHISICTESMHCIVLSSQPDTLTLWKLEKSNINATAYAAIDLSTIIIKKRVVRADICPNNNALVSVIGEKVLRMFHVTQKNSSRRFIPVPLDIKVEPQNYTSQCWLKSGDLIIGAENGEIIVLGEDRMCMSILGAPSSISCIAACPRGFVVGCSDGLLLQYQRPSKVAEHFALSLTIRQPENPTIVSMEFMKTLGRPESYAVCLTKSRSIIKVKLESSDNAQSSRVDLIAPSLNTSTNEIDSLIPDSGSLCVDVCVWKTHLAIGGYDGFVRIYNYHTHKLELTHQFEEKICDLSFHPSGFNVLFSTPTKVCLCSVLPNEMRIVWEIENLNGSSIVRFSESGDKFAISIGSMVQVHSFYTLQNISSLRGHSKEIIEIRFSRYRDELTTIGSDGVVCLWDVNKGLTKSRCVDINSPLYVAGCGGSDGFAFVSSSDGFVKKINVPTGAIEVEAKYDHIVTSMMALSSEMILASLDDGAVNCITLATDHLETKQFCHHEKIAAMKMSNGSMSRCFIADKEGFLNIFNATECVIDKTDFHPMEGLLVVSQDELAAKESNIESLETEIKQMQDGHLLIIQSMEIEHAKRKTQLEIELKREQDEVLQQLDKVTFELQQLKEAHRVKMEKIAKEHRELLVSVEEECKEKLQHEERSTDEFRARCDEVRCEFNGIMEKLENSHTKKIETETVRLGQQMTLQISESENIRESIRVIRSRLDAQEKHMEKDAETELSDLTVAHQSKMKTLLRDQQLLEQEKSMLQRRYDMMKADLREVQEQVAIQEDKIRGARDTIAKIDAAIASVVEDITRQDLAIILTHNDMMKYSQANLEDERINVDLTNKKEQIQKQVEIDAEEERQLEKKLNQLCDKVKEAEENRKQKKVEVESLELKLYQIKLDFKRLNKCSEEKEQFLLGLKLRIFTGSNSVVARVDDNQLLKTSCFALFEEYLDRKNKRFVHTIPNEEKMDDINSKISKLKDVMKQKASMHKKDMARLSREHSILKKVKSYLV